MRIVDIDDVAGRRVLAANLFFPETPRFRDGELVFVDGPLVRAVGIDKPSRVVAELPTPIALGIAFGRDGTIYAGGGHARAIYEVGAGGVRTFVELREAIPTPINEIVLLPSGDFLVGEMGFDRLHDPVPKPGRLHRVSPTGSVEPTGPDLMFPNGTILTDDAKTLYVCAGMGTEIRRLALDPDGRIVGDEVLALSADPPPSADGICRDQSGRLWYADMGVGGALRRGDAGRPDVFVRSGCAHATCCWTFNNEGEEWLVIGALDVLPLPGTDPALRTGKMVAAPLSAILKN